MTTTGHIRAALLLAAALSSAVPVSQAQTVAPAALAAAESWVKLVDEANAEESWRQSAALFKTARSTQEWSASVQRLRRTLGPLERRALRDSTTTEMWPTGQRGDLMVVEFDSAFQQRVGTTFEAVALVREADGQWRVVWYEIK